MPNNEQSVVSKARVRPVDFLPPSLPHSLTYALLPSLLTDQRTYLPDEWCTAYEAELMAESTGSPLTSSVTVGLRRVKKPKLTCQRQ